MSRPRRTKVILHCLGGEPCRSFAVAQSGPAILLEREDGTATAPVSPRVVYRYTEPVFRELLSAWRSGKQARIDSAWGKATGLSMGDLH